MDDIKRPLLTGNAPPSALEVLSQAIPGFGLSAIDCAKLTAILNDYVPYKAGQTALFWHLVGAIGAARKSIDPEEARHVHAPESAQLSAMGIWNYGCGADDCKHPTYDIFDQDGNTLAREVSYENAAAICEAHNKAATHGFDDSTFSGAGRT
jgi:hypothetical protein